MDTSKRLAILAVGLVVLATLVATGLVFGRGGGGGLVAAFDAEFHNRPDGYRGLCAHYGFSFPREPLQMDPGLMYQACADGKVDVIDAFATDGRIAAFDLQVLVDDRRFFPPYHAAPLVRAATLAEHPELARALAPLAGAVDDATMQRLNYRVDEQGETAAAVARSFLVEQRLLTADAAPRGGRAGTVRVGGKQFTEQEVLGEMIAQLIECTTDLAVDRRLNLGGTMICFNALKSGDLDCYAEYTGTGLVNILEREVIADPDAAYAAVKKAFAADYGLTWLAPFGFNNTYTLTMRRDHARELGIETISDLASHLGRGD